MKHVSSVRLTVPEPATGVIIRQNLIDKILNSNTNLSYIHAGAGYGKTTLLSQVASLSEKTVWLALAGESDIFSFVDVLCKSMRRTFPYYDFIVSEYLPFMEKDNFITSFANALIASMENLEVYFTLILDDLHSINDPQIREFLACFMKYMPDNIRLLLGSRESLWQDLVPLYIKGSLFVLSQKELAFTQKETFQILDFGSIEIYQITEGWPLAVGSFRLLLENGMSPEDIPKKGNEALYSYLFYECINCMSPEKVEFLKVSACFGELDASMLDAVLNKKNTRLLLESLVSRNMFTTKIAGDNYRYHALFRSCLMDMTDASQYLLLQQKASQYYCDKKDYSKAAEYALKLDDKELLQKIILFSYKNFMKSGNYSELRCWFQALGDISDSSPEILVAKGSFLSSIGNFVEAKACLDAAIPQLNSDDNELYIEAMLHKARVLRNFVSFEESNKLLDELAANLNDAASELSYALVVEKLYNLCWNSQISEALELGRNMVEACARAGNLKTKAWFERYMSAVYFFAGQMKESVFYYEKSLSLPEEELQYLDMHSIGIYAAKAYQMLGDRDRSLVVLSEELCKLRSTGKYEEMWFGYLFAAEIHYQNTSINRVNGESASYETTMKYFTLADEYAPLFRKTDFQMQWAKMQRLTYSLMFTSGPKKEIIDEIFVGLDLLGDYLRSIILARLFGYLAAVGDYQNAVHCAKLCITVGENARIYLHSTLAYGMLARISIANKEDKDACHYTERFLRYCYENGIYEYFRARKDYDPILEFASNHGIEPEITKYFMDFAGFKKKKAYIKTFGGFTIFPFNDQENPLKMRTKKERELFAALLDAGARGMTKEEIYDAIWSESESEDVKKLIGVNLSQIKKDLSSLGIENALVCNVKRYSICRDEIECDFEIFESIAIRLNSVRSEADEYKILELYTGEYLSDFEAFWATSKRIHYQKIYEHTAKGCSS